MDQLQLDASQAQALALAQGDGGSLSFNDGTQVTVVGTSFLGHGAHGLDDPVHALFSQADLTLKLASSELPGFHAMLLADPIASADFAARAQAAGVDSLSLGGDLAMSSQDAFMLSEALQGITLAAADKLAIDDGEQLLAQLLHDAPTLHEQLAAFEQFAGAADTTVDLSLPGVAALQVQDASALSDALQALQIDLAEAGFDQLMLTDDLANALADSDISFLQSIAQGGDVAPVAISVEARADNADGTAYLRSSLQDLQELGVDEVVLAAGVRQVEVALRDQVVIDPTLTLADLPRFQHSADQIVSLVLEADDLAALLATPDAMATLHDQGFTDLRLDFELDAPHLAELQSALQDSGLHWSSAALTQVEVELLGLGTDPIDPFGFYTPPKG
jgi:hypothetical protein